MSLLITGTDTSVGKTVVSALILLRYREEGVAYWKPVATGAGTERDSSNIRRWTHAEILPESYLFRPPVSPHLAARRAGRRIDPNVILQAWSAHRRNGASPLVIEGIGGVLVPFDMRGYFLADLARDLRLPALVVARSTLGTINHTLLTLETLRRRRVSIAGVVLNGPPNLENRRAIERLGRTRVVGEVRPLRAVSAASLARAARAFDLSGSLQRYFR
jgi:dethiobiotin synthetase/malonyl-CoA O-methyltransferase